MTPERSAEQGVASAQYSLGLGLMHDAGRSMPQNDMFAYAWRNLAAARATIQFHELRIACRNG